MDFGINVIWFSKEKYLPGDDQPVHSHKYFHYIFVLSGKAHLTVGGQRFDVQADEFFLTPAGVTHSLRSIDKEGLRVIEIKFDVHDEPLRRRLTELDARIQTEGTPIRYILENLIREGMSQNQYYSEMIHLKVMEVLICLIRGASVGPTMPQIEIAKEPAAMLGHFDPVLAYLDANLDQEINLDRLAKLSRMSKHYFCRNFKSLYGISPIQYLNKKRLARAKELMLYSDLNITQISAKVGVPDIHYFSRIFKKHERMSPQEYLKKHKPNLYFMLDELNY
ncbi:AraC family transcriptional regulator [Paenibacillus sp. HJGM_3]|uniref:helix-turn-helix transcriptional regulator n=1 Tax=Paenibacillus sp. HJGM_3 TaxID=3379816 RepID=UPI00386DF3F6